MKTVAALGGDASEVIQTDLSEKLLALAGRSCSMNAFLEYNPFSLINKVRPLVSDGGTLVVVNNFLFLSGKDFLSGIDGLCDGAYLRRETLLPVPDDFTGSDPDYLQTYAVSPEPFNHPTKIVILRVVRK